MSAIRRNPGLPELLIPVGNFEKLRYAIGYGADAVYAGGKAFSLRAGSDNFELHELAEGIALAHSHGVRFYVTVNSVVHNGDLPGLKAFLGEVAPLAPDAFIVADPGALSLAQSVAPAIPLHLSTQANTVNVLAAKFWEASGVTRIVLARELSLDEIRAIRDAVGCELEAFVHGAMCISYSGRCLLSNFLTGRDANQGECTQTCRWQYHLMEEKRPGQYFEIGEDQGRGTYILNSRDLCMIEHLEDVIAAGVDSIKVEGRMKSIQYVAGVTKAYRMVLDSVSGSESRVLCDAVAEARIELDKVSHRPYTTGFFYGKPTATDQVYASSRYVRSHHFVGNVIDYDSETSLASIYVRNRLAVGESVELLSPDMPSFCQTIGGMVDARDGAEGVELSEAHANYVVKLRVDRPVQPMSILRRPDHEKEVGDE